MANCDTCRLPKLARAARKLARPINLPMSPGESLSVDHAFVKFGDENKTTVFVMVDNFSNFISHSLPSKEVSFPPSDLEAKFSSLLFTPEIPFNPAAGKSGLLPHTNLAQLCHPSL